VSKEQKLNSVRNLSTLSIWRSDFSSSFLPGLWNRERCLQVMVLEPEQGVVKRIKSIICSPCHQSIMGEERQEDILSHSPRCRPDLKDSWLRLSLWVADSVSGGRATHVDDDRHEPVVGIGTMATPLIYSAHPDRSSLPLGFGARGHPSRRT
jgi:hypothetical protein